MRKFVFLLIAVLSVNGFGDEKIDKLLERIKIEKYRTTTNNKTLSNYINIGINKVNEDSGVYDTTVVGVDNFAKGYYFDRKTNKLLDEYIVSVNILGKDNIVDNSSTAIGKNNVSFGGGITFGNRNKALVDRSYAIGDYAQAKQVDTLAIGFGAKAYKTSAQSIGGYSEAKGIGSVSLGDHAISEGDGVALGYRSVLKRKGGKQAYLLDSEFKGLSDDAILEKATNSKEGRLKRIREEIYEIKKDFTKLKTYNDNIEEYKNTFVKMEEIEEKFIEKKLELYKAEKDGKTTEEISKLRNEYEKLRQDYRIYEKKEEELRDNPGRVVFNEEDNKKIEKIKELKKEYIGIIGGYRSTRDAVSIGDGKSGSIRQIVNVAGGSEDTDAVNVAQLKSITLNVEGDNSTKTKIKLAENKLVIKGVDDEIVTNIDDKGVHIGLSEGIKNKINEGYASSKLALSGVTNAIAIANLPQVSGNKKFSISSSYGYYGRNHALAIGFSGKTNNQKLVYKISGSANSEGNLGLGVGLSYQFGEVNDVSNFEERLIRLEKENQELKKQIKQNVNK